MSLTFRCFAYRSRESWEAICPDLDIAVFGDSIKEVEASLDTCIQMHLEEVFELPPQEQSHLLARRAPWYVWAKLALITCLGRRQGNAKRVRRFTVESHVPRHPSVEQAPRQAGLAPDSR